MTADVQSIVVGAGAVGLAVGRALAMAGHEVMLLEQHALIGSETSSRNSEVIHAGIYYPPGSLRATLCVRGKELLYAFCAENSVPHARCGKLLVATQESQVPKLAAIRQTAERNGVHDLEPLGGNAAKALEPELACVGGTAVAVDRHHRQPRLHAGAGGQHRSTRRQRRAALPGGAHRADAGRAVPPGDGRRQSGCHHLPQPGAVGGTACFEAGGHAELRDGLPAARDLLRQGTILRALRPLAVPAPHLPDAGRRLAWPACHGRYRRALQVRPRHRVDPRPRLQLRAGEARRSSSSSSAATIRGWRSSACTPTTRASGPSCTARARPCPTSPSTAPTSTGRRGSSRCTASRARG